MGGGGWGVGGVGGWGSYETQIRFKRSLLVFSVCALDIKKILSTSLTAENISKKLLLPARQYSCRMSPRIWAHIRGRYWSAKIDYTSLCNPLVSIVFCAEKWDRNLGFCAMVNNHSPLVPNDPQDGGRAIAKMAAEHAAPVPLNTLQVAPGTIQVQKGSRKEQVHAAEQIQVQVKVCAGAGAYACARVSSGACARTSSDAGVTEEAVAQCICTCIRIYRCRCRVVCRCRCICRCRYLCRCRCWGQRRELVIVKV